jgi:pyrimidine operon attenuation protein / uracil phosphoribosyltransferase
LITFVAGAYLHHRHMLILDQHQIKQKIKRLAVEILEHNLDQDELVVLGVNNNGMTFAQLIVDELKDRKGPKITVANLRLDPADPLGQEIAINLPIEQLNGKAILIVDDVANSGRSLFYALQPLTKILPQKVEILVLVDRKHKRYAVQPDYVGLSLATTLLEHIKVELAPENPWTVSLH